MPNDGLLADRRKIAVIGLGYVGLPVAVAFAEKGFDVVGFDVDRGRIAELRRGNDATREVRSERLIGLHSLALTDEIEDLRASNFFIVTVPTPITEARSPDLGAVLSATRTVGTVLKRGDIVVYESTVYPGVTEEECLKVLEAVSGLKGGEDFTLGYSPERINPGDKTHRFEKIVKVVSGQDAATLDIVAATYGAVVEAGIHRAPSIKVAEAAKVIENVQRDINIALMNELALIFSRLGIDTNDVLEACGTKWNFLSFRPGLVGGHCIGVDPYYLTHKAQVLGYHPELVLAGRRVNDGVARHVADECARRLLKRGLASPRVTVLGITFKEDVPDIRNSKVADIVYELKAFGIETQVADPEADSDLVHREYGFPLTPWTELKPADAIVLAVSHRSIRDDGWRGISALLTEGRGDVLDVKGVLDRAKTPDGISLWRL